MFGDNVLVVNSTVMPVSKLHKRSHILNYQRTRESQSKGIIKFVHMNGNDNPDEIFRTWLYLTEHIIISSILFLVLENKVFLPSLSFFWVY